MGMEVITGSFASSTPWSDISMAQLNEEQQGYNIYNGKFISISNSVRNNSYIEENVNKVFRDLTGRERHEAFEKFIEEQADKYNYFEKGEICLICDNKTVVGYDIIKRGEREAVDINKIPNSYLHKAFNMSTGYTLISIGKPKFITQRIEYYSTLADIDKDERINSDVLRGNSFFIIKNDLTKAYILQPNKRRVKGSTVKSDGKTVNVREVHPYYYYANVAR